MSMTLRNNTRYVAQYVVKKGELVIARLPGILPGAQMSIPTIDTYEVTASTIIDGNTYTSATLSVTGSMGFLAQVRQLQSQGSYEFDVQEFPIKAPDQLSFQKTCLCPVTFTISKDGRLLQHVVVNDSYLNATLDISNSYYIYAVINGVTTEVASTSNPDAVVTAETDSSDFEQGYFFLSVQ